MRTLLHGVAMVLGVAVVYRGLDAGLPGPPLGSNAYGQLAAFAFGVLLVLVGLRYLGRLLLGEDEPLGTGTTLLLIALAVAATAGAVKWKGKSSSRECAAILAHVESLFAAREGADAARARFEELGPGLMKRCAEMPTARRRCPLQATTLEEFKQCP